MILQVRSSEFVFMPVGVSAYCLGRAWSLILILMLLSHPLIYSTRAERWPWQPSVFPWRNLAWMVSSSSIEQWSVPQDFAKQKRLHTTRIVLRLIPGAQLYIRFLFTSFPRLPSYFYPVRWCSYLRHLLTLVFLANLTLTIFVKYFIHLLKIWTGGQSWRSSMHQYPSGITHHSFYTGRT